jgi:hypothetical protein
MNSNYARSYRNLKILIERGKELGLLGFMIWRRAADHI